MNKTSRYIAGFMIGMIFEFLLRVEFNYIPFIILILMVIIAITDIITKE